MRNLFNNLKNDYKILPKRLKTLVWIIFIMCIVMVFAIREDMIENRANTKIYNHWLDTVKVNDSAYVSPNYPSRWPHGRIISLSKDSVTIVIKTTRKSLTLYK